MPGAESYLSPAAQAILGSYGDLMKTRIEDVKQQNASDARFLEVAAQASKLDDQTTADTAYDMATKSWHFDPVTGKRQPMTQVFNRVLPAYNSNGTSPAPPVGGTTTPPPAISGNQQNPVVSTTPPPPSIPVQQTKQVTSLRSSQNSPSAIQQLGGQMSAEDANNLRIANYLKRHDVNNMLGGT